MISFLLSLQTSPDLHYVTTASHTSSFKVNAFKIKNTSVQKNFNAHNLKLLHRFMPRMPRMLLIDKYVQQKTIRSTRFKSGLMQ